MTAPVNKMLKGMGEYFLSKDAITKLIASRLTRGVSETRIVAQERPDSTIGTRLGQFVEYELAGGERDLLSNAKSKMHITLVEFRFFARFIDQAAALYDEFYDCFGSGVERLSATWGDGQDYETKIMGARWDDNTATDDRDQNIGMSFMSVVLVVPFAVV